LVGIIIFVDFIVNLPSYVVINLLEDVLELVIGDHIETVWHFDGIVVLFVRLRLLKVLNFIEFIKNLLIVCFTLVSRVAGVICIQTWPFSAISKWLVIGSNVREPLN
jgi:hypothetical protein